MLVLTRKLGENIRIGDSVKITVLEVRSGQVKLGIEAPPEVKVHREEIYARIQAENQKATAVRPPSGDTIPTRLGTSPMHSLPPPAPPAKKSTIRNRPSWWPLGLIIGGKSA